MIFNIGDLVITTRAIPGMIKRNKVGIVVGFSYGRVLVMFETRCLKMYPDEIWGLNAL